MIHAVFEGGPLDGEDLGLSGQTPGYLLMMRNPIADSAMKWIVVGADFDDGWPDQIRYERVAFSLVPNDEDAFTLGTVVYRYVAGPDA